MKKDPHYSEKFRNGSKIKSSKAEKLFLTFGKRFPKIPNFTGEIKRNHGCLSSSSGIFCHSSTHFHRFVIQNCHCRKIIISGLFYMVYFQDERHEFNCELEWDSNLLIRPLVLCNMQGVQIRRLMVAIICIVNLILVFIVIYCFIQRSVDIKDES